MKLKSLLFGSAAVIAAGTGAQAADLPIVEPVEYVRICDAFGTGFYYIPGTDTCLRIGGQVRTWFSYTKLEDDSDVEDDEDIDGDGIGEEEFNNFTTRARGNLRLDARTQTDFGLIRAFFDFQIQVDDAFPEGDTASDLPELGAAFIQISNDFGTFTVGHTGSNFDFFGSAGASLRLDIDDPTDSATQAAFTFAGGNGFSATIAAEDAISIARRDPGEDDEYEGQESPDLVGNIRLDQGWGSLFVAGALHPVHDLVDGDDDTRLGWAGTVGASLGLPFGGIKLSGQASYADGAIGYVTTDPGGIGDIDDDTDELHEAWSVRAGLTGNFTPTFGWAASASYTEAEEDDDEAAYEFWAAKGYLAWTPAPGLEMGPAVVYNDFECTGDGDCDDQEDVEAWEGLFFFSRTF